MRSLNPDELIRRWQLRQEEPEMKLVALPGPIVWEIAENAILSAEENPATVILRPFGGELLVSLGTKDTSERTLRRRPNLPEEAK